MVEGGAINRPINQSLNQLTSHEIIYDAIPENYYYISFHQFLQFTTPYCFSFSVGCCFFNRHISRRQSNVYGILDGSGNHAPCSQIIIHSFGLSHFTNVISEILYYILYSPRHCESVPGRCSRLRHIAQTAGQPLIGLTIP